jgi:hypothetical protein
MFAAVSGIIAVLITMAIAKAMFNKRICYIAGFIVAVFGIHIHFSRFGFPFIQNALFGAIVILLLVLCEKKRYLYIFALTGISIGIAQYTWSAARVLMDQLLLLKKYAVQALLEFNFYPDRGYCYAGPGPMLPFITSILFAIGLFYLITMWKKPNSLTLLLLFFGTVFGLVAMTGVPNYQRAVVLLSLPPIFAALAVDKIYEFISKYFTFKRSYVNVILVVLITFLVFENYNDYFNVFIKNSHANPNRITKISEFIKTQDPSYKLYLPDVDLHTQYLVNIYLGNTRKVYYGQIDKVINDHKNNSKEKAVFILFESVTQKAHIIENAFSKETSYNLNGDDGIKIITVG